MGGFCPSQNIKVLPSPVIQEEIIVDPQIEIITFINQENNYKLKLTHNFSLENPSLQTCDEVILEILSISISFMVKDFSEQSNFLKMQIQKQVQDLMDQKSISKKIFYKCLSIITISQAMSRKMVLQKQYLGGRILSALLTQNKQQNIGLKNLLNTEAN